MMFLSSRPWHSVVYWALHVESVGLDAGRDATVTVGMVPVREGRVRTGEAFRATLGPGGEPRAAAAPGARDELPPGAPTLAGALLEIDRRVAEGVLLVHHRALEIPFLRTAHERAELRWPGPPVVDTVDLLVRLARRHRAEAPGGAREVPTNLAAARAAHGLPPYEAHDAVTGALAAAELFLVLRHELGARSLRDLR